MRNYSGWPTRPNWHLPEEIWMVGITIGAIAFIVLSAVLFVNNTAANIVTTGATLLAVPIAWVLAANAER
jgi:hypothetical protein